MFFFIFEIKSQKKMVLGYLSYTSLKPRIVAEPSSDWWFGLSISKQKCSIFLNFDKLNQMTNGDWNLIIDNIVWQIFEQMFLQNTKVGDLHPPGDSFALYYDQTILPLLFIFIRAPLLGIVDKAKTHVTTASTTVTISALNEYFSQNLIYTKQVEFISTTLPIVVPSSASLAYWLLPSGGLTTTTTTPEPPPPVNNTKIWLTLGILLAIFVAIVFFFVYFFI